MDDQCGHIESREDIVVVGAAAEQCAAHRGRRGQRGAEEPLDGGTVAERCHGGDEVGQRRHRDLRVVGQRIRQRGPHCRPDPATWLTPPHRGGRSHQDETCDGIRRSPHGREIVAHDKPAVRPAEQEHRLRGSDLGGEHRRDITRKIGRSEVLGGRRARGYAGLAVPAQIHRDDPVLVPQEVEKVITPTGG